MTRKALFLLALICPWHSGWLWAWDLYPIGPSGKNTSLALDSRAVPYVAYLSPGNNYPMVSIYQEQGGFSAMPFIAETKTDQVALALDTCGNPNVLFRDITGTLFLAVWNGAAWSIEPIASNAQYYDIAIGVDNTLHIAYLDYSSHAMKYLRYRTGTGWTSQDVVPNSCYHISIALDSAGAPHICYTNTGDFSIKHAWSNGAAWSAEVVDPAGGVGGYSSIAIRSGVVFISYWLGGNYNDVKCADNHGGSWNFRDVDVGPATAVSGSHGTRVCVNSSGEPQVAFVRSLFSAPYFYYYLYCDRWIEGNPGSWSLEQILTDDIGNGAGSYGCIDMACDTDDFLYVSFNNADYCFLATNNPNPSGVSHGNQGPQNLTPRKEMEIAPNPFRGRVEIRLPAEEALGGAKGGVLSIYDAAGRLVRKIDATSCQRLAWDGKGDLGQTVPAGLYLLRFSSGDHSQVQKAVLLK